MHGCIIFTDILDNMMYMGTLNIATIRSVYWCVCFVQPTIDKLDKDLKCLGDSPPITLYLI